MHMTGCNRDPATGGRMHDSVDSIHFGTSTNAMLVQVPNNRPQTSKCETSQTGTCSHAAQRRELYNKSDLVFSSILSPSLPSGHSESPMQGKRKVVGASRIKVWQHFVREEGSGNLKNSSRSAVVCLIATHCWPINSQYHLCSRSENRTQACASTDAQIWLRDPSTRAVALLQPIPALEFMLTS